MRLLQLLLAFSVTMAACDSDIQIKEGVWRFDAEGLGECTLVLSQHENALKGKVHSCSLPSNYDLAGEIYDDNLILTQKSEAFKVRFDGKLNDDGTKTSGTYSVWEDAFLSRPDVYSEVTKTTFTARRL